MGVFKGLFHTSLYVNDIEASIDFYQKMGLKLAFEIQNEGQGWNYYMKIADGQYMELQAVKRPMPFWHPEESKHYPDQSIWHFSFETDNMVEMIEELRANGIRIFQHPAPDSPEVFSIADVPLAPDGCWACWVKDPDGNPIELMEQSKHSLQRLADIRFKEEGLE